MESGGIPFSLPALYIIYVRGHSGLFARSVAFSEGGSRIHINNKNRLFQARSIILGLELTVNYCYNRYMEKYAVIAIVENNGKILVGKKIEKPSKFLSSAWHIPGGKLDKNETEKEALVREIQEEAGIKISVKELLDEGITPTGKRSLWYLCSTNTQDVKPGDDLTDAKFISKSEVKEACDPKDISRWPLGVIKYFNS